MSNSMNPKKVLELKKKLKEDREEAYKKNEKYKKQKKEEKKEERRLSRNSKIHLERNKNRLLDIEEKYSQQNTNNNELDNNKQRKIRNIVLKEVSNNIELTDKHRHKNSEEQNTKTTQIDILNKEKNTIENTKIKKTDLNFQTKVNKILRKALKTKPKKMIQKARLQEKSTKRVQKFRAKMTDEKREEKRRKDRERYKKLKEEGRIKSIKDLDKREQRNIRKKWKVASLEYRKSKKSQAAMETFLDNNSPPISDNEDYQDIQLAETSESPKTPNLVKSQKGRKKVKRDRAECYRKLKKSQKIIEDLRNKLRNSQRKDRRQKLKIAALESSKERLPAETPSPATKINKLVEGLKVPEGVKRRLVLGEALHLQLKENVQQLKTQTEKQIAAKIISGKILRKYNAVGDFSNIVSYKMSRKVTSRPGNTLPFNQYCRKKRNNEKTQKVRISVKEFLEKDCCSKMCPGKKDYVRKGKIKKQKRLLLDSLKNLYKKYIDSGGLHISETTFVKYKPFWIVRATHKDRNTCACIKHENIYFIISSLQRANLINARNSRELINDLVCDTKKIDCMFRRCLSCKQKICRLKYEAKGKLQEELRYYQWETKAEERYIKDIKKQIKRTVKNQKTSSVKKIFEILNKQAIDFLKHVFIMENQMLQLHKKKQSLKSDEIIIQVDFSENYVAKYSTEIQSMHFGASKKQISLHTGIYYFRENSTNLIKSKCFCSVSDNLDHQCHAIWAHLDKLLLNISTTYPAISKLHFFSDGPTSQYKNRFNIFFLISKIPKYFKNIQAISWNYSASGHGKGPMDGVGGALKRKADCLVLSGTDISSAESFIKHVSQNSSIEIWEVSSELIETSKKEMPKKCVAIPQIMSLHQITWSKKNPGLLFLNHTSCFSCETGTKCLHFSQKPPLVQFEANSNTKKEKVFQLDKVEVESTELSAQTEKIGTKCLNFNHNPPLVQIQAKNIKKEKYFQLDNVKVESLEHAAPSKNLQTQKSVNIISQVIIPPSTFCQNEKLKSGLCFICTFNLSATVGGVKCGNCSRTYHIHCILKHVQQDKLFLCTTCSTKINLK